MAIYSADFKRNLKCLGTIWVCLKMLAQPLHPMVLLIIIPSKWLLHWEYTQHFQTNPYDHIPEASRGKPISELSRDWRNMDRFSRVSMMILTMVDYHPIACHKLVASPTRSTKFPMNHLEMSKNSKLVL